MTVPASLSIGSDERLARRESKARTRLQARLFDGLASAAGGLVVLGVWEATVRLLHVSKFILPPPSLIIGQLVARFGELMYALAFTATITLAAFALATLSGVLLGVLLTQNARVERMLWPYAIALQVTPMVAIAPLVVIWVGLDHAWLALMILAWIVAFFPVLSNTMVGMKSTDHGLRNLFSLYRASRTKRFLYLELPSALPYILAGLRVSAGLSVIGAVVAEFVAGSGSATGLAWTIVSSGTMLDIPQMFAALIVLAVFGLLMNGAVALIQHFLLGAWHESAVRQEN
ncbi:ABC transporter permease [Sphingomonas sp. MMS24-J13]|uniref:ABC transporter permease n=1 Tax=Sphingomonas sp. MMS24-J13 TaxID=3238686 RepID=UPI00384FBA89